MPDTLQRELTRDSVLAVLRELQAEEPNAAGVTVSTFVRRALNAEWTHSAPRVTSEAAVSILQELIADGEVRLSDSYRVRVSA